MEPIVAMLRVCPPRRNEKMDKKDKTVDDADGPVLLHLDQTNRSATAQGKTFYFDHVFPWRSVQEEVYEIMSPRFQSAFEGMNGCFMTYGQTGTGKSFSVFGSQTEPGVLPRLMKDVFSQVHQHTIRVWITFVEIYQEQLRDLLAPEHNHEKLQCIDHPALGVVITNLTESPVECQGDVKSLLKFALTRRAIANTNMNSQSSRSHVVFTWRFLINDKLTSKLRFVDLAGSERSHSARTKDQTLEGNAINSSLSVLGLVIRQLTEMQRAQQKLTKPKAKAADSPSSLPHRSSVGHAQGGPSGTSSSGDQTSRLSSPRVAASRAAGISWRSSKLTFLLKDSLAGNSRSALLATCSGELKNLGETVSTMRFAVQVSSIRTVVRVTAHKDIVVRLKEEIRWLKTQLYGARASTEHAQSVVVTEEMIKRLERSFSSEVADEEKRKEKRATQLVLMGVDGATENQTTSKVPFLLNIDKDPLLYGSVMYPLPVGLTSFGNSPKCKIKIKGCGIGQHMCNFVVELPKPGERYHRIILQNPNQYRVLLNGNEIVNETELSHNDRLILGRALAFRLVVPDLSGDEALNDGDPESDYGAIMEDDVSTAVHDGHEFWLCMGDPVERLQLLQSVTKMVADINAVADELESNVRYSIQLLLGDMEPPILITKTSESTYSQDGTAKTTILSHIDFLAEYRSLTDKHHSTFVFTDEDQNKSPRRPTKVESVSWTKIMATKSVSNLRRSSQCITDNLLILPGPLGQSLATGTPLAAARRASVSGALMSQAQGDIATRCRSTSVEGEDDDEWSKQIRHSQFAVKNIDSAELRCPVSLEPPDRRDTLPASVQSTTAFDEAPALYGETTRSGPQSSSMAPGLKHKQIGAMRRATVDAGGASYGAQTSQASFASAPAKSSVFQYFPPARLRVDKLSVSHPTHFVRKADDRQLQPGTDGDYDRAQNAMQGVVDYTTLIKTESNATDSMKNLRNVDLSPTKDLREYMHAMPLLIGGIGDERTGVQSSWDEALLSDKVKMLVNTGGTMKNILPNFARQEKAEKLLIQLEKNPKYLLWRKFDSVPHSARELHGKLPTTAVSSCRKTR